MNFSTLGIRTPLKDYELAYWLNKKFGMKLVCRPKEEDSYVDGSIWKYNVYDGVDPHGERLCLVNNHSAWVEGQPQEELTLFQSTPQRHLLLSVKQWDYLLLAENQDFALELEEELKRDPRITTALYFEAHTQMTQQETHLLYEIRTS